MKNNMRNLKDILLESMNENELNEAMSASEKKKYIGLPFIKCFNLFDKNTPANKITFRICGEDMWIKDYRISGSHPLIMTLDKKESISEPIGNFMNQVSSIILPQDSKTYKEHYDSIYITDWNNDENVLRITSVNRNIIEFNL